MLEQMSRELSQLSAAYSAKCLENSQLDEKISEMQANQKNNRYPIDYTYDKNMQIYSSYRNSETIVHPSNEYQVNINTDVTRSNSIASLQSSNHQTRSSTPNGNQILCFAFYFKLLYNNYLLN
jgi:hypothetical protein